MTDEQASQDAPRKELVAGSVNDAEKSEIEQALAKTKHRTMSEFVRETMLDRARRINTPKRATDLAA